MPRQADGTGRQAEIPAPADRKVHAQQPRRSDRELHEARGRRRDRSRTGTAARSAARTGRGGSDTGWSRSGSPLRAGSDKPRPGPRPIEKFGARYPMTRLAEQRLRSAPWPAGYRRGTRRGSGVHALRADRRGSAISCPCAAILRTIPGCSAATSPTTKNVPRAPWSARRPSSRSTLARRGSRSHVGPPFGGAAEDRGVVVLLDVHAECVGDHVRVLGVREETGRISARPRGATRPDGRTDSTSRCARRGRNGSRPGARAKFAQHQVRGKAQARGTRPQPGQGHGVEGGLQDHGQRRRSDDCGSRTALARAARTIANGTSQRHSLWLASCQANRP